MAAKKSLETLCIHGDTYSYREDSRAISFPIYQTASFSHLEPGHNGSGFDYTRESNPTRSHLEETLAAVEGAADCVAFSSGMAAITACFELFRPGDHIIASEDLYGGTESLITYPIVQTHPDVPQEMKDHLGITDTLIRSSVGLENAEDLIADLNRALNG